MRRVCVGIGLLMAAALGAALFDSRGHGQQPAAGVADATHKRITVTGTATVTVKPDTARVSFAVKGVGADIKAAVADCDKKAAAVKKAIDDAKVAGLEIKAGPIHVVSLNNDNFGRPPGPFGPGGPGPGPGGIPGPMGGVGQPPMGGPPGANSVEVSRTFTAVARFAGKDAAAEFAEMVPTCDKLLTTAITAGATENPVFNTNTFGQFGQIGFGGGFQGQGGGNSRVEFHRSNWSQLRQEALKLAVADAVANAKAAAGVANLTAKDIVAVTDQNQYGVMGLSGPSNTGRNEVLGEQELTVQVSVTFSY